MNTKEHVAQIMWGMDPLLTREEVDLVWTENRPDFPTKAAWLATAIDQGYCIADVVGDAYNDIMDKRYENF